VHTYKAREKGNCPSTLALAQCCRRGEGATKARAFEARAFEGERGPIAAGVFPHTHP